MHILAVFLAYLGGNTPKIISGISLTYLGHTLDIFWAYLGHLLGISRAYFRHILGISWTYIRHILGIFWAYHGHILGISWAYINHIFGLSWAYLEYPLAHLVCPLLAFFYQFYIMYHISWYSSKYVHEPDEVYICWILPETSVPQTGKKFPERKNYVTQFEDRKVTMSKLFRRWLKNLI